MRELSKALQEAKAKLGQISEEAISNIRTVKAFACESEELSRFDVANLDARNKGIAVVYFGASFAFLFTLLFQGMYSVIVFVGSLLAKHDLITVGQIISFMLYLIQLVAQFGIITGAFTNLFKISGASEKIVNIM